MHAYYFLVSVHLSCICSSIHKQYSFPDSLPKRYERGESLVIFVAEKSHSDSPKVAAIKLNSMDIEVIL